MFHINMRAVPVEDLKGLVSKNWLDWTISPVELIQEVTYEYNILVLIFTFKK